MVFVSPFLPIFILSLVALFAFAKEREKRFVQINPNAPFTLGKLFGKDVSLNTRRFYLVDFKTSCLVTDQTSARCIRLVY